MRQSRQQPDVQQLLDEYLVLAVAAGDREAANQLARRWRPRLLRTARRLVEPQLADDAVQDTWVSIARGIGRLRDPALLWLAGFIGGIVSVAAIKIWFWLRMQQLVVLREIKKIELRVAALSGR